MDRYALFGNPVQQSLSPLIHHLFAKQTHQALVYTPVLVPLDRFAEALAHFKAQGGKGLNVTLPFKQEAYRLTTTVTERALRANAVNTLCLTADGGWLGDNTDGIGFIRDVRHNQGIALRDKRILLLGAGGAIRGILGPLLDEAPRYVMIANRTLEKTTELVKQFAQPTPLHACSLSSLPNNPFDIIIHGTSAGLQGTVLDLNPNIISQHTFCYDLAYGKSAAPFLRWAQALGALRAMDGLGMLVEQAAEAFYLWRKVKPNTKEIIAQLACVPLF